MQAMAIKRQQQHEQQQRQQHQIQQQQLQIQQMQMMAQMGGNSSFNPQMMSTDQQQMQQLMGQVQQQQQQQQQALDQSGAQGIVPLDAFGGNEDFESDEAIKEMLNNFDVGNLDSLGFEFDSKGQSR